MAGTSISPEMDAAGDLAAKLRSYLTMQHGTAVEVSALTRLSSGWESDVYAFDVLAPHAGKPPRRTETQGEYVLRLYFGADAGAKARQEADAYDFLMRLGYPVPRVSWVEPATEVLGRAFLIMQRIQGVSLGRRWHDPDPAVQAREVARFCTLFASLHTLEWQELAGAERVPAHSIDEQVKYWGEMLTALKVEGFAAGVTWLVAKAATVTVQPLGLVHWDFHHENILVDTEDQAWVIDWTQFQATDVRFDLAWTLVVLASERDAASAQQVRAGYLAQRGWQEEEVAGELAFFEAAACLKRLASVAISLQRGADALGMRPGAEQIMISRLARIALVYRHWLELTQTPLAAVEQMLAV